MFITTCKVVNYRVILTQLVTFYSATERFFSGAADYITQRARHRLLPVAVGAHVGIWRGEAKLFDPGISLRV